MKKRCLQVVSLLAFLCSGSLYTDQTWNGNVNFGDSVLNENLSIEGDSTFQDPITITVDDGGSYQATLDGDYFVKGTGTKRLNIILTNGNFTFILDKDLTFKGEDKDNPLFISVEGKGRLRFELHGGKKLILGAPGALFYVDMGVANVPLVEFTRAGDKDENVEVVIEKDSAISFMAETKIDSPGCLANEKGVIRFKTGSSGVGRYVLRIKDKGGFIIAGQHKTGGHYEPSLNNLDRSTPAGCDARVEVMNNKGPKYAGSLLVINENKTFSRLLSNPFEEVGGYTGKLFGFIVGANGVLDVLDCAYVDYVGTRLNGQPKPDIPEDILIGKCIEDVVRERNASAMIIDGFDNECACSAKIKLDGTSAVYYRSGVDAEGNVEETTFDEDGNEVFSFLVDAEKIKDCLGNIVLDVEGVLDVVGNDKKSTALNILSLQVEPTGGTVAIGDTKKIFPLRTFARDMDDQLLTYNKADFFINNRMNLFETVLNHDDRLHEVWEKNSPRMSEPTYIGGEKYLLFVDEDYKDIWSVDVEVKRPRIALINSRIDFHESAAFAGVDIFVPNYVDCGPDCCAKTQTRNNWSLDSLEGDFDKFMFRKDTCGCEAKDNNSFLRFYYNGNCLDNGTGRQLILGTNILCSCVGLVDCDAHLDIMQEFCQDKKKKQQLSLDVAANNATIREEIAEQEPIAGQFSINTIYLGCSSNITIGTDGDMGVDPDGMMFNLTTKPTLCIAGNYFSFDTQGGPEMLPELSGSTGKGAIFVDNNGVFKTDNVISNISTMVVKSGNALIDLPKKNVYFNSRVGITNWQLDLADEDQRVIVKPGECYSNYTIDWINVCKDVCDTVTGIDPFMPYVPNNCPTCECPPVQIKNIEAIPTIEGEVIQFQVKRSRIGDPVHLKVDGTDSCNALIRELVFLTGWDSAEAPTGVLVLKGGGTIGLGSLNRYVDSTQTNTQLGVNGIVLVPDGDGTITMNSDLIITNICHIVPGPNFGKNPETGEDELQSLTFCASDERLLRVKSGGVLDLSLLNDNQQVVFAGLAGLVLEPGARIRFSPDTNVRGNLEFTDSAQFRFNCGDLPCPFEDVCNPTATDKLRSKISGTGRIEFSASATMILESNAFLGIESDPECSPQTDISLQILDNASLLVGPSGQLGGALQVGNTQAVEDGDVKFELVIDGLGASVQINSEGYIGLGAGIISKPSGSGASPSDTKIGPLLQASDIKINLIEGTFQHNIIDVSSTGIGQNERPAGTFAIGPVTNAYQYIINNLLDVSILGGGNIINIGPNTQCVQAVIEDQDGLISGSVAADDQVQVGTHASKNLILDANQPGTTHNTVLRAALAVQGVEPRINAVGLSGNDLYEFIKTQDISTMQQSQGNIAVDTLVASGVNYVLNDIIFREVTTKVTGSLGVLFKSSNAHELGFVGLTVNTNGMIDTPNLILE